MALILTLLSSALLFCGCSGLVFEACQKFGEGVANTFIYHNNIGIANSRFDLSEDENIVIYDIANQHIASLNFAVLCYTTAVTARIEFANGTFQSERSLQVGMSDGSHMAYTFEVARFVDGNCIHLTTPKFISKGLVDVTRPYRVEAAPELFTQAVDTYEMCTVPVEFTVTQGCFETPYGNFVNANTMCATVPIHNMLGSQMTNHWLVVDPSGQPNSLYFDLWIKFDPI